MSNNSNACSEAGERLFKQLKDVGISVTMCGVTSSTSGDLNAIRIGVKNKIDVKKVPTTFESYEVSTVCTGVIRPL